MICILPFCVKNALGIFLVCLFFISSIILAIYAYICSKLDPSDRVVIREVESRENGLYFSTSMFEYYCNVCKAHCKERSKHCNTCNRCVEDFDHHCKWLNNCIGSINYR